ncbi:MAG: DUF4340 domain-containing protein [Bryobacteraceae bacterium]
MRTKGLLIASAVLALLAGAVWWSNRQQQKKEKSDTSGSPKLVDLRQEDITRIEIIRPGSETTRVEKGADGVWRITSPEPLPGDKDAISSLVSSAASVSADKVVEEKPEDLAVFGLKEPRARVVITLKDGKSRTLLLGEDAPVGGGGYAQVEGDPKVYLLTSWVKGGLDKLAVDLRDKRILTFDREKIVRVEVARKAETFEFSKNAQGSWVISRPKTFRADSWSVDDFIRRLQDLKLDPLLTSDQKADLEKQFRSGTPVVTVSVTDAAGVQKLELRQNKDKYYARSSAVEGFHLVQEFDAKALDKAMADFRNKKLFDFGFDDPSKIEYRGEKRQLSLTKSGEKWLDGLKPVDPVGVQTLIDRLRELSAASFPDSGFTSPVIEVTVNAKSAEKVLISKSGGKYIARREGEPALYELSSSSVEELEKAAGDIKEAPAGAPAKK